MPNFKGEGPRPPQNRPHFTHRSNPGNPQGYPHFLAAYRFGRFPNNRLVTGKFQDLKATFQEPGKRGTHILYPAVRDRRKTSLATGTKALQNINCVDSPDPCSFVCFTHIKKGPRFGGNETGSRDACTPVFIAASFTIPRCGNNLSVHPQMNG